MKKSAIRSKLLKQRKSLDPNQINSLSKEIVKHIIASNVYQQASHIAVYLPFAGEVDLTALLQNIDKQYYLPSIHDEHMQFQKYTTDMALKKHRYGIIQPKYIETLEPAELELCLMPLAGFDLNGNRLGMGGGFYDRYFEENQHTTLAGAAYEFQHIEQLPADSWDVKLQHIFTEHGFHTI